MSLARTLLASLLLAHVAGCGDVTSEQLPPPGTTDATESPLTTAVRVEVARVHSARLDRTASATGTVQPFRMATVAAEVGGRVVERRVEPGSHVGTGDLLVRLDDTRARLAHESALANLAARRVDLADAEHDVQVGRSLYERHVISKDELDDRRFRRDRAAAGLAAAEAAAASAARELADTRVGAPFAGSVERVHAQVGDYLAPGTPVAAVADFDRVRVIAGVTAAEAAALSPGHTATVLFADLDGASLEGAIHSVGRMSDPDSRTYPVEIWLDGGAAAGLREGMVASVLLPTTDEKPRPVVPTAALLRNNGRMTVYVVENDRAFLRPVRVGRSNGTHVQIIDGVQVGERVVVDGLFALRDGANVRVEGS